MCLLPIFLSKWSREPLPGKRWSARGKPQGNERPVIIRDGQDRAWLCQDSKTKAGRGYICSLQIHVETKRECCGERKAASEEAASSALSCCCRLKRVPSHWCREVLKQPSRSWSGKNNFTPLILQLDQVTAALSRRDCIIPKVGLYQTQISGCLFWLPSSDRQWLN